MTSTRIAGIVLSLAAVACSVQANAPEMEPSQNPQPTATINWQIAETVAPTPTSPSATTTMAPFVPFTVTTWADNVVLHTNAGHLSPKLGILADNTAVTLLGRAPGNEWLMVKTADNRVGWLFGKLVESGGPEFDSAPLMQPTGVLTVRGHLTDVNGDPVNGVQFSVVQAGVSEEIRTDAITDDEGYFYAFVPGDAQGSWWVSFTAISCDSRLMDATCSNWSGEPEPKGAYVQLPGGSFSALQFLWR